MTENIENLCVYKVLQKLLVRNTLINITTKPDSFGKDWGAVMNNTSRKCLNCTGYDTLCSGKPKYQSLLNFYKGLEGKAQESGVKK